MPRRNAAVLTMICAAFFFRGLFYCVEQPLWEGYDEWAHFAYVHNVATFGRAPSRVDTPPAYVRRSLELLPLSPSAAGAVRGSSTYESFWDLSEKERRQREREIRHLTSQYKSAGAINTLTQYEAQQPPMYYAMVAPFYALVRAYSLPLQVLVLRIVTLALSMPTIVFAFGIATRIAPTRRRGG